METTSVLVFIVSALIGVIVYFIQKKRTFFKVRGIPYIEPDLFYGNFKGFRKDRIPEDIYRDLYNTFKGKVPFCGIFFFQSPRAFILDRQLAKNILIKDFSNFADRGLFHNERDDPLTGHLFALDGLKWKQMRQKLSPTFTSGKMKFMFPTVVSVGQELIEVTKELIQSNNNIVEIKELLARFTTDVIGTCAFGIECNSLKDPNAEFRNMGRMAFLKTRHGSLLSIFIASWPDLARKLRMRQIHEDIHQFFMRTVRETVAYREKNNIKRNDFMNILIELKNNTKIMKSDDDDELSTITVEEIAAQAFVFFLAGFETSSTTMGFALYELAQHQDIQDKLRAEIVENFAKHNDEFTYESMKEMQYMQQVISETLRLYTIVPHLIRQAIDEYVVPGHPNFVIEKGMGIIIPSSAYHHDPDIYPEPMTFNPDRFSPEMTAKRDSIDWLPFGDGPRNCIGLRFGKMQTCIGLTMLLKNFKFSVCKNTQIPIVFDPESFILSAKGGIYLKVEKV